MTSKPQPEPVLQRNNAAATDLTGSKILLHLSEIEVLPARLVPLGSPNGYVPVLQCEKSAVRYLCEGYATDESEACTLELRSTPCQENSPSTLKFGVDAIDLSIVRH